MASSRRRRPRNEPRRLCNRTWNRLRLPFVGRLAVPEARPRDSFGRYASPA